jgi:hypothetical protein
MPFDKALARATLLRENLWTEGNSMSSQASVIDPAVGQGQGCECRVYERHTCGLPSRCQPASSFGKEDLKWTGTIENVSKGGVCLKLTRRFEKGTGLAVELPGQDGKEGYTVLARVVHVRREDAGDWALGCQFISELSDEELQRLLPTNAAMHETLPISGDSDELRSAPQAAPATNETPKERQRIPSVQLNLEIAPRTTIGCVIADFAAGNCQWPLAAGTIGVLKGTDDAGNAWKLKVKIRRCQSANDGWSVDCQVVNRPSHPDMLRILGGLVLRN